MERGMAREAAAAAFTTYQPVAERRSSPGTWTEWVQVHG